MSEHVVYRWYTPVPPHPYIPQHEGEVPASKQRDIGRKQYTAIGKTSYIDKKSSTNLDRSMTFIEQLEKKAFLPTYWETRTAEVMRYVKDDNLRPLMIEKERIQAECEHVKRYHSRVTNDNKDYMWWCDECVYFSELVIREATHLYGEAKLAWREYVTRHCEEAERRMTSMESRMEAVTRRCEEAQLRSEKAEHCIKSIENRITEGEHRVDNAISRIKKAKEHSKAYYKCIDQLKMERNSIDPMGWLHVILAMMMIGVMCISKTPITT